MAMPIWDHIGVKNLFRGRENTKWADCQRRNHQIMTMEHMMNYTSKIQMPNHRRCKKCACVECRNMRSLGCSHPTLCKEAGIKILDNLKLRWDPRIPMRVHDVQHHTAATEQRNQNLQERAKPLIFDPLPIVMHHPMEELQIFRKGNIINKNIEEIDDTKEAAGALHEPVSMSILGLSKEEGFETSRVAEEIWYGEDDP